MFPIDLAFIGRIDDSLDGKKNLLSLAFIGWTDDSLDGNKILRFSCLRWLDI